MKENWRSRSIKTHGTGRFVWMCTLVLLLNAACTREKQAHEQESYTCPMHPTVIADRPGTCPVCGMELVKKAKPGEEVKMTEELVRLTRSTNEVVTSTIKTVKGKYQSMPVTVDIKGVVTYDTRNLFTIAARTPGRLEKVYLKYAFQRVSKGQKIAELYSPELVSAQRELLFLIGNDSDNAVLIEGATKKLKLLGLTDVQIKETIQQKKVDLTVALYSPYSGYLVGSQSAPRKQAEPSGAATNGMDGGMNEATVKSSSVTQSETVDAVLIREGSYVSAGQRLWSIVNTDDVRIEFNVPPSQSADFRKGEVLELNWGNTKEKHRIDLVQPFFSEGEEFVKVRVIAGKAPNQTIGQLVNASLTINSRETLWIPETAVVDLGKEVIVFIKDKNVFKPKTITTGVVTNGMIEVKTGLASADEVAVDARYLIDSESFIKTEEAK